MWQEGSLSTFEMRQKAVGIVEAGDRDKGPCIGAGVPVGGPAVRQQLPIQAAEGIHVSFRQRIELGECGCPEQVIGTCRVAYGV